MAALDRDDPGGTVTLKRLRSLALLGGFGFEDLARCGQLEEDHLHQLGRRHSGHLGEPLRGEQGSWAESDGATRS
jgi:hypothetical protein